MSIALYLRCAIIFVQDCRLPKAIFYITIIITTNIVKVTPYSFLSGGMLLIWDEFF